MIDNDKKLNEAIELNRQEWGGPAEELFRTKYNYCVTRRSILTNVKNITCKGLPKNIPEHKIINHDIYDYDKFNFTLKYCHTAIIENKNYKQEVTKIFLDKR